jgi:cytochrome P450
MADPLAFVMDNLGRHPQVFRSELLAFSAYVVHHPAYIRHVLNTNAANYRKFEKYRYLELIGGKGLVTNEGEAWVRQRRIIQPAFSRDALERACTIMWQATGSLVRRLAGERVVACNLTELMGALTIEIAARALFTSDVGSQVGIIRSELDCAQRLGNVLLRVPLPLYDAVPYLPVFRRISTAANRLRALVAGIIARRKSLAARPGDLLDALLAAQSDPSSLMSDDQLRDEVLTLLLAGHETTLLALSWALHLVALHPEAAERLAEEAAATASRPHDIATLDAAPWSRAIAREAMRLYPPAYFIGRTALQQDALGDYHVPAGTNILINIYGIHRHPAYWTDPDAFLPARMLDPAAWDPKRFVYLPFGAGPRSCIGARLALYEMQVVLLSFARAFVLEPITGPVGVRPRITLGPARPIVVRLKAR